MDILDVAWLIIGIIFLGMLIYSSYNLIKNIKYKHELEIKYHELLLEEQNRTMQGVADDIHELLGHQIYNLGLHLNNMAEEKINHPSLNMALTLHGYMEQSIKSFMTILSYEQMYFYSLEELLKDITCSYEIHKNIKFHVAIQDMPPNYLDQKQKILIIRITKEIIQNILKHTNATDVYISMKPDEKNFSYTITDNHSMIRESDKARNGLGINFIERSIRSMTGTYSYVFQPQTVFHMNIPIGGNAIN